MSAPQAILRSSGAWTSPRRRASADAGAPLRVALFTGNYNYVMDGPARALNLLVDHLEAKGHAVLVFAPTTPNPAFQPSGTLIPIPSTPLPGARKEYRFAFGLPRAARTRLDQFAPTLIHIATPDWLGLSALRYGRRRGVPVVASYHTRFETYPQFYGVPWLEGPVVQYLRWFYARCTHVYPPTQAMIADLRAAGLGKDLRLWARGVDGALFNPNKRSEDWRRARGFAADDIVVAWVGRIVLEKGADMYADAVNAAAARNPKIRALVVGDGPERARLEARLPNAVFVGYQAGADLARAYASADIFFNPSITETFGQVNLEAMASGLACVCAAATGSSSLLTDGANGRLVPPERGAEGFAAALAALAADAPLRARFGPAARARAEQFSWTAVLDGLIANYREAAAAVRN
jgi:glycosyltransferase involved in cell wall biosynthesis